MTEKKQGRLARLAHTPPVPFMVLFAVMVALHLLMQLGANDDLYYRQILLERGLFGQLQYAYHNWSGRTMIDMGVLLLNQLPPMLWRVLDAAVVTVCAYALACVLGVQRLVGPCWFICGMLVLYPWAAMASAGWVTTTGNFLWPGTAAVLALVPVARILRGQALSPLLASGSLVLLIYAANMEQVGAVYVALTLGAIAWRLVNKRGVHWLQLAQLTVALASLLWNITAPGTAYRYDTEVTSWFVDFGMKSTLSKVELGISLALADLIYKPNMIFWVCCLLLAILVFSRYRQAVYRVCALVPLVVSGVLGLLQRWTVAMVPKLAFFTDAVKQDGIITLENSGSIKGYLPLLLLYGTAILCIMNLYLALGHTQNTLAAVYVLCVGMASRAILGFSATAHVSGVRTGFFFMLTLIGVAGYLFHQTKVHKRWQKYLLWAGMAATCLCHLVALPLQVAWQP